MESGICYTIEYKETLLWFDIQRSQAILLNEEKQYVQSTTIWVRKKKSFWKDMEETAYISCLQRKEVSGEGKKWKDVFYWIYSFESWMYYLLK